MGRLSRINQCPRVLMDMACPECGYLEVQASKPLDPAVPHQDPYIEIGPKGGRTYKISMLWITGADKGT